MRSNGTDRKWPFAVGSGSTIMLVTLAWATAVFLWQKISSPLTRIFAAFSSGLWLLILYFFRDPNRNPAAVAGLAVSPADGEVVEISRELESNYLQAEVVRISIFLSLFDVHVQRTPLAGKVTLVQHRPGKFLQAFRPEASAENEHIAMVLKTDHGDVLVKQIAGILARRCVNYARPGDALQSGQRFGMIRFGSRVDLFLPVSAQILIQLGDKVTGGITPLVRF